jgi:hypothetical protein
LKVNRMDFLAKLLMVEPGIAARETIQQSSCVILKRKRLYTLSMEIACSLLSGLPEDMEGAVRAEKLVALLKLLPDEEVDISIVDKILHIKGRRKATYKIPMEAEIVLPVDEVERPINWSELDGDFSESVDLAQRCTIKKTDEGFAKVCIHCHPKWLESCDNRRMIRYPIKTFVKSPVLVRGETFKSIVQMGMTKGCETDNWLHFKNPSGLRMSLRKYNVESYPDLATFLNIRGRKVSFPKGLKEVAERVGLFAEKDLRLTLDDSKHALIVEGRSVEGEGYEECKMKWDGDKISFLVPPKMLAELVTKHAECEVTEASLRVDGGKYVFCSALEMVK